MRDYPNTEATISEIMGAISLRVLWATLKNLIGLIVVSALFGGIGILVLDYYRLDTLSYNPVWTIPMSIIGLWLFFDDVTGRSSFHRKHWYFPRTNLVTSFIMAVYVVLSIWLLVSIEIGPLWAFLFLLLLGVPQYIYYLLNCGYYLVMMRRYPRYADEDFAIKMPSVLFELSMKDGGITGVKGRDDSFDDGH